MRNLFPKTFLVTWIAVGALWAGTLHAQLVDCKGPDDTEVIQAAINKHNHVILPAGICHVSTLDGTNHVDPLNGPKPRGLVIEGQGLELSQLWPTKSGVNVIDLTGSSNVTLSKFRICGYCTPKVVPSTGILSAQTSGSAASDVFGCDRVRVDGSFSLAAIYILSVASSNIEYCQFYNYQPDKITAIFTGNNFFGAASTFATIDNANDQYPSDWTITGSEFHNLGNQAALWLGGILGARFYGGNASCGSATCGHPIVSVNKVTGKDSRTGNDVDFLPADIIFDGTTFYTDEGAQLTCGVSVDSGDPSAVTFRANFSSMPLRC
jgi:hypothetical protein